MDALSVKVLEAAAAGVVGVAAFMAVISHGLTWYEIACHPLRALFEKTQRPLRATFLLLTLRSFFTQVWLFVSYPPGFWPGLRRPPADHDPDAPALLLFHGLYHNPAAWIFLRYRLVRAGWSNVRAGRYETIFHDYEQVRAKAIETAREVLRERPGRPLVLIGHSLGGLMVRECLLAPDVREHVLAAVTLGAPHGGSKLATFGLGRTVRSLMRCSPEIARLNDDSVANPPGLPCLSIFAPMDNMVLPPEACWLPGTCPLRADEADCEIQARDWPDWEQAPAGRVNHISLLFNRKTHAIIIDFLKRKASTRLKEPDAARVDM